MYSSISTEISTADGTAISIPTMPANALSDNQRNYDCHCRNFYLRLHNAWIEQAVLDVVINDEEDDNS